MDTYAHLARVLPCVVADLVLLGFLIVWPRHVLLPAGMGRSICSHAGVGPFHPRVPHVIAVSGALGRGLNFHLGKKAEKISRVVETASSETGSESVQRPALALGYCVSLALLSDVGNIWCKDAGPWRGLCSLCHTQFPVPFGVFCSHCKPHGKGGCSLDQGIIWSDQANAKFSRPLQGPLSLSLAPALPRFLVQSLFCCLFASFLSLP